MEKRWPPRTAACRLKNGGTAVERIVVCPCPTEIRQSAGSPQEAIPQKAVVRRVAHIGLLRTGDI